jgi:epoxide hydrolase-like predicted phosphatase
MTSPAPKAVLFDFFGVVADERYWTWLGEHIPDLERRRNYFQELADRGDRGEITRGEEFTELGKAAGVSGRTVADAIYRQLQINDDVRHLIEELHRTYKTALLSNASYRMLEAVLKKYHLLPLFDAVVISSQVHLIKPQPEIFELALAELSIKPSEAIFVDDREPNVRGARAAGLRAILFTDVDRLRRDLERAGVTL